MRKLLATVTVGLLIGASGASYASPESDRKAFQDYFKKRFPDVQYDEFINGVYAINAGAREQWMAIEEFPPYQIDIDAGKKLFETPFKNGQTYASCFPNGGIGIADQYPQFDTKRGEVITLSLALNECRVKNGEEPLPEPKGKHAALLAYMAFTTRGKKIDIKIPDDPRALEAYERGKSFFYARRGQLNMACAHCHVDNAGNNLRANILSPAFGHPTHFPVYRSSWGDLGTLHRRFVGCNEQVRAKPFKEQSREYRDLEYFLTYMSNGLTWNGPGARE
jgi:sulfur-oxidizing protein SoxA